MAAIKQVQERYDTMDGYGGQAFEIEVEMPGVIIGHNGDKEDDGCVTFEFDGKVFRDRPHTLLVTSFVANDAE
jgi:hypothetical protein